MNGAALLILLKFVSIFIKWLLMKIVLVIFWCLPKSLV